MSLHICILRKSYLLLFRFYVNFSVFTSKFNSLNEYPWFYIVLWDYRPLYLFPEGTPGSPFRTLWESFTYDLESELSNAWPGGLVFPQRTLNTILVKIQLTTTSFSVLLGAAFLFSFKACYILHSVKCLRPLLKQRDTGKELCYISLTFHITKEWGLVVYPPEEY